MIDASNATAALWLRPLVIAITGASVFVLPGAAVLAAGRFRLRPSEALAWSFAVSLVVLGSAFAAALALEASLGTGALLVAAVTAAIALAVRRTVQLPAPAGGATPGTDRAPVWTAAAVALLLAFSVFASVAFAPVGSVDRWWYLAYVRSDLVSPALTLAEPFLGTGEPFARFGVHPWLFGLALWSRLSATDPVAVYENAAPVLVVLASASAAAALARQLFGDSARARLSVVAAMLLWTGGLVPVLARAGEDKILAASALMPLCFTAFLRAAERAGSRAASPGRRSISGDLVLLLFAAAATATVHALDYALALIVLLPLGLLLAAAGGVRRDIASAACALLVMIALGPMMSGTVVRSRLHDIGASLDAPDHPVVRVHEGRDRLHEIGSAGYVVSPRLLLHPLVLLAFSGVVIMLRRAAESAARQAAAERGADADRDSDAAGLSAVTLAWLAMATVVALALAFVPPLPALLGSAIPPWMVYRVLWLLPVAPLAAMAAHEIAATLRLGEPAALALLLVLGVPIVASGTSQRLGELRGRLAAPDTDEFRAVVDVLRSLPAEARIVAAPELAERLPAWTGRAVVAGLDRSTVVFAGTRENGEARLRARAAALAGDDDSAELAAAAAVTATHAVYDPRGVRRPRCTKELHAGTTLAVCELAREDEAAAAPLAAADASPTAPLLELRCDDARPTSKRDPWSATPPLQRCSAALPPELRGRDDLALRLHAWTGRAADELRVTLRSGDGRATARAAVRLSGERSFEIALPRLDERLEIDVASSFLPYVRVRGASVVATR